MPRRSGVAAKAGDILPILNELRLRKPCDAPTGHRVCLSRRVSAKHFVYILKNSDPTPKFYVGLSTDVDARLMDHNMGRCPHTASRRPWRRHVVIEFADEPTAIAFERYLKSGSGVAFAQRHLR